MNHLYVTGWVVIGLDNRQATTNPYLNNAD